MSEKILVIGGGFLGSSIVKSLTSSKRKIFSSGFKNLKGNQFKIDIRDLDSIEKCVSSLKPDFIINCAANTDIEWLEKNHDFAFKINADGAKNIVKISKKYGARLIHISTDSVFDGKIGMYKENDIPNPINVYAKSKLRGEEYVSENSEDHVIVRTNFFGIDKKGKNLLNWVIQNLQRGNQITGFDDIIFTPLEVENLSIMIYELMLSSYKGIIHLSNYEALSKYQFALTVAEVFEFNKELIKKGSIDEISFVAKRPKNTSLSNKKAKQLLKTQICSIRKSLDEIKLTKFY